MQTNPKVETVVGNEKEKENVTESMIKTRKHLVVEKKTETAIELVIVAHRKLKGTVASSSIRGSDAPS